LVNLPPKVEKSLIKMDRQQFLNFMQYPEKLNGLSVAMLADVVKQFPYCQTAQLLYLKNLNIHKSIHYNHQLKVAAAYSSDRKKLYELVIQPSITRKISQIEEVAADAPHDKKRKDISPLEKELLKEAVNASIQLEVAQKSSPSRIPDTPRSETIPQGKGKSQTQTKIQKDTSVSKSRQNWKLANKYTFNEWVKVVNKEKQTGAKNLTAKSSRDLIDMFVKENPQVMPSKPAEASVESAETLSTHREEAGAEFFSPVNAARLSVIEDENFITETLAKIYMKQKNYSKAIRAYKILSLQNPDKSSTFAARIESIKKLINKEKGIK